MANQSNVELVIKARDEASRALKAITEAGDAFNSMQGDMSKQSAKVREALNQIGTAVIATQKNMSELGKSASNINKLEAALNTLSGQQANAQTLANSLARLTQNVVDLTNKQNGLKTSQDKVAAGMEATQLRIDAYRAKMELAKSALSNLQKTDGKDASSWITTSNQIDKLNGKLEGWRTKLAELQAEQAKAGAGSTKNAAAIAQTEATITSNEAKLSELVTKLGELDAKLATNRTAIEQSEKVLNSWQKVIRDTTSTLEIQKAAFQSYGAPLKSVASDIATVNKEFNQVSGTLDRANTAIAKQEATVNGLKTSLTTAGVNVNDLAGELTLLSVASQKSEAELARLAVRAESMKKLAATKLTSVGQINLPSYSSGVDPRAATADTSSQKLIEQRKQILALQDQINQGVGGNRAKAQLAELVEKLKVTAAEFKNLGSSVEQLQSELNNLTELKRFAGEIEKQEVAVAEARSAYQNLKNELKTVRSAYNAAGVDATKYAADYERSLAAAAQGRAIYQNQVANLRSMRQAFDQTSLSSEHMTESMVALDGTIARTVSRIQNIQHAADIAGRAERTTATDTRALGSALGAAAGDTIKFQNALDRLSSNGRTTLSFLQRIRGDVLAVTAAYVGLYGVYNQFKEVYQTEVNMSAAKTKLTFVNDGDKKKAEEDLKFVKEVSNGLGTNLNDGIKNFANFAAATKGTNLAGDRTKLMFYNLSKAGRALRIGNDDMKGSFIALQQMINKQKVSAEELTQQLGERFPGATQKFAKAMEKYGIKSVKDLFDQMSKGNVDSDAVYLFTKLIGEETTAAAKEGADAVDAWANRADNALTELKQKVAEGGFSKELALALQEVNQAASTPEAQEAFTKIGQLAGNVIRLFAQLIIHADDVGEALKTILEVWVAWKGLAVAAMIFDLVTQFQKLKKIIAEAAVAQGLLTAVMSTFGITAAGVGAAVTAAFATVIAILAILAIAAYAVFNSEWLYENSETVRDFVDYVSNALAELRGIFRNLGTIINTEWTKAVNELGAETDRWAVSLQVAWNDVVNFIKRKIAEIRQYAAEASTGSLNTLWDGVANALEGVGADDMAKRYRSGAKTIQTEMAATAKKAKEEADAKIAADKKWEKQSREAIESRLKANNEAADKAAAADIIASEKQIAAEKAKQAEYRKTIDAKGKNRSTTAGANAVFDKIEGQAQGIQKRSEAATKNDADINPLSNGEGKGNKAAENLVNRLNDQMEKVRAKIAELAADTESESLDAIRLKVTGQYEKLIRDLEKAGRTADANQVRSLIEIETKAKQAELRQKTSEKAEKSMNDLLSQRKEILTALANARNKGDAESGQSAEHLTALLKDNEAQLRQSVANAGALAQKYGDVKLANEAAVNTEKLRTLTMDEQMAQLQSDLDKQKERKDELLKQLEIVKEFGSVEGLPNADQLTESLKDSNKEMGKLYDQMIALAVAAKDFKLADKLRAAKAEATNMNNALITADQVNQTFASNATTALMSVGEGFGKILSGTMSLKEGFKAAGTVFRQFASDFLKQIAQMIIQAAILKAIQGTSFGGMISGATTLHGGGVVGSGSALAKSVNPMIFASATRYHTGGVAGLAADEVPAVLQQGEEVLTQKDPRHRNNLFGQGQAQKPQDIKIVNTIDAGEFTSQGMSTAKGQQAVLNYIRSNKSTIQKVLGMK